MTLPAALDHFARLAAQSAFVTDFDGTLAQIVNDPAKAAPLPESVTSLRTLAAKLGLVAVVSGRPVEFLHTHIPIDDVVLVGQYGLERWVDGHVEVDSRAARYVDAVAAGAAEAGARWPELMIERKGNVAFTVHWRMAPGAEPHADELAALAAEHGLQTQPGRKACEMRPPVPVDKGTVFQELARPFDERAFAGDDHGDLAAFAQEFGDPDHTAQPFCIAVRSSETPPELLEQAQLIVDGPVGLAALLGDLADAVSSSTQS